mmetsp:Transcript_48819/g.95440  ORF Transcript_48819/g.95440 Transcript_48819/m.95440 type:complete len:84 (-) Transcript_48819:229-480(-)
MCRHYASDKAQQVWQQLGCMYLVGGAQWYEAVSKEDTDMRQKRGDTAITNTDDNREEAEDSTLGYKGRAKFGGCRRLCRRGRG